MQLVRVSGLRGLGSRALKRNLQNPENAVLLARYSGRGSGTCDAKGVRHNIATEIRKHTELRVQGLGVQAFPLKISDLGGSSQVRRRLFTTQVTIAMAAILMKKVVSIAGLGSRVARYHQQWQSYVGGVWQVGRGSNIGDQGFGVLCSNTKLFPRHG